MKTEVGQRESLAERAYAEIRDRIITLQLPPKAPIDEDALVAELGVGRTPIREALKRLALEALVDIYPRRGTFVSEIRITDLAAISEVREQLEAYAASLAAERITAEGRAELERLVEEVEASADSSVPELIDLDARVHRLVYRSARNPYLERTLEGYYNLAARIWHFALERLPSMATSVAHHRDLLVAIRDGDGQRAGRIAAAHVAEFESEMRRVL